MLALGGPREEIIAKEYAIAGGGTMRIWAASPISVRVSNELPRAAGKAKTESDSALDIPQNAFDESKVRFARDNMSDFGSGENEVCHVGIMGLGPCKRQ